MLRTSKLNQFYGESHTLWDIDVDIVQGQCTVLMGRNGVGKTTFLKVIMGLLKHSEGNIYYAGNDISHLASDQRARTGIAYVPQGREIFSQLTVEENLQVGLSARNKPLRSLPELIFDLFPVLKTMLKRRGGDLSGGQQQQLAIARALTLEPKVLLLDEPTEGIQPNIVHEIGSVIRHLVEQEKITVLLVEQKLPFAKRVGNKFILLDRGRVVGSGDMGKLSDELIHKYLTV